MSGNEQQTFLGGPDENRAPTPKPKTDEIRSGSKKHAVLRQLGLRDLKGATVAELRACMVLTRAQLVGILTELVDAEYVELNPAREGHYRPTTKGWERLR